MRHCVRCLRNFATRSPNKSDPHLALRYCQLLPVLASPPCGCYSHCQLVLLNLFTFFTRPPTPLPSSDHPLSICEFAFVCSFILFRRFHIPAGSSHLNLSALTFLLTLGLGPPFLREHLAQGRFSASLCLYLSLCSSFLTPVGMDPGCFPAPPASADPVSSLLGPSLWPCVAVSLWEFCPGVFGEHGLFSAPLSLGGGPHGAMLVLGTLPLVCIRGRPVLSPCRLPSPLSLVQTVVAGGDQRQVGVSSGVVLGGGQQRPSWGMAPRSASLTAPQSWLASPQPTHKTFPGCLLCPGRCHSAECVSE